MGQYYNVYYLDENGVTVYDRSVDGEYTMAKLTEHSWWRNPFMSAMCKKIYHHPAEIAWVGDYSDFEHYEEVWGENAKLQGVHESDFTLDGKYLVNHSKKEYLDGTKYFVECAEKEDDENNEEVKWCLHPLSLLTATGNGRGGGDYHGINKNFVGIWCMDELSIEDHIPSGYEECFYRFYC